MKAIEQKKKAFEALVRAVYALREVRDNNMLRADLPFTDEEKKFIKDAHKQLDDITERLEHLGIEKDFI